MKFLICGLGSIGERHLNNLLTFDERDVIAYRKRGLPLRYVKKNIPIFSNIDDALSQKPDIALITNPTKYHIPTALKLAQHGCHLFIEKPLSNNLQGIEKLSKLQKTKKIKIFIGFMMRYHPAAIEIKKWLDKKIIGTPLSINLTCGENLALWHPWENYQDSYAANKELSGGIHFTLCHEIDLLCWYFGFPQSLYSLQGKKSTKVKTTTEHSLEVLFKFKNNMSAHLHLDIIKNPPKRIWEFTGDQGWIEFDYITNKLKLFRSKRKLLRYNENEIDFSDRFQRNDMFVNELKMFINTVKSNKDSHIPLTVGIDNLRILIAIEKSLKEKKPVTLKQIR